MAYKFSTYRSLRLAEIISQIKKWEIKFSKPMAEYLFKISRSLDIFYNVMHGKKLLLSSEATIISRLRKEEFNWAIQSDLRNLNQPLEKLLGTVKNFNAIFSMSSSYVATI